MKTFAQIMTTVRDEMRSTGLDAFIFTDLVELQTAFSGGLQHVARWDGVTRKPTIQGPGDGVSADFDWAMLLDVASLQVSIYDMELKRIFASRGGIDATQAIDSRSSKAAISGAGNPRKTRPISRRVSSSPSTLNQERKLARDPDPSSRAGAPDGLCLPEYTRFKGQ